MNWYVKCLQQYADFNGRARRTEYWMFTLVNFVIGAILTIIGIKLLSSLYSLAVLIPSIAVAVRRLHDIGKSGWMYLLMLVPLIGWIWLIILFCQEGKAEANQWGENPKKA